MRVGFYSRLALDGVKKNKKLYFPFILTSVLMVAIFYIIIYLQNCNSLRYMKGGETLQVLLGLGVFVIAVFATIFLFYTNSFLIKRRKKEFGLYNILGMDKHGISKVLFWENLFVYAISTAIGLAAGFLLSKLFEVGLTHLIAGVVDYDYSINLNGILVTLVLFGGIFLLIFLNGVRQVRFSNVIDLVKSANVGEKAPKANWFLGLIGAGILGYAYYMAVKIENPISALLYFFIAVILVIISTYILMIAGSVVICKVLQKNKNYYYKKSHFVSVSSMLYRMKRNGAGLASICILLTMILVTISSTTCLYFGQESSLKSSYPCDITMTARFNSIEEMQEFEKNNYIRSEMGKIAGDYGTPVLNEYSYTCPAVSGSINSKGLVKIFPTENGEEYDKLILVMFRPLSEYNEITGQNVKLGPNEAIAWCEKRPDRHYSEISFMETGDKFTIKEYIDMPKEFNSSTKSMTMLVDDITLVVDNFSEALSTLECTTAVNHNNDYIMKALDISWYYGFDTSLDADKQIELTDVLHDYLGMECSKDECPIESFMIDSIEEQRIDFYATFAGFFFLGLMLSAVFLMAAVLMIYYKQITEGYEDQPRFIIMQKVGMTKKDIKKSINSQMLTVFFLPLALASIHMAFAFNMVSKLLFMFGLSDISLFAVTTVLTVLAVAIIYVIVYKITSGIYYNLVSSANAD